MRNLFAVLVILLLTACVPAKTWISQPTRAEVQNADFTARLTPQKRDKAHFVSFRLVVQNNAGAPIQIDWNRSRYLCNGKFFGPVVFPDIDPAAIKKSIPPDTIPAGGTFNKEVFPLKLVAFAPMREDILDGEGRGLYPGPLPEGKNTIDLVIRVGDRDVSRKISVDLIQVEDSKTRQKRVASEE